MWLLLRSVTIRLRVGNRVLPWIFEGDGSASQMEGYFSVLLFSFLLFFYWFVLFVCIFLFHYYYFCNWSFRKILCRRLSLVMSFYYCFSPMYTLGVFRVETTGNTRRVLVGTLLEVSSPLMSFEKFDSFSMQ